MRGSSECYRGSWGGKSGKFYYDTSKILRLPPPPLPPLMINNGRSLLSRENNIKFYLSHFWAGRQNFRIVWLPFKYTFCFRFVLEENDKERKNVKFSLNTDKWRVVIWQSCKTYKMVNACMRTQCWSTSMLLGNKAYICGGANWRLWWLRSAFGLENLGEKSANQMQIIKLRAVSPFRRRRSRELKRSVKKIDVCVARNCSAPLTEYCATR